MSKFKILCIVIKGFLYKWLVDLRILSIPQLNSSSNLIISLTSYGRRVGKDVVYYTIVSILRQSVQPSKIILWLAEDEWNDSTLSKRLLSLKEKGVLIKYCKDIRSYKKLIPTLKDYPNNDIMTIDDDIIYNKDSIKRVLDTHKRHPNAIISMCTADPIIVNGIPNKYNEWKEHSTSACGFLLFPIGYGGIYYPKGCLHSDIMKDELFMELCPAADDIWFWFCGLLNGSEKIFVPKSHTDYSFDALYQYFHKGSALTHSNRLEHANDKQFRDLFEHYHAKINNKGKLEYHIC